VIPSTESSPTDAPTSPGSVLNSDFADPPSPIPLEDEETGQADPPEYPVDHQATKAQTGQTNRSTKRVNKPHEDGYRKRLKDQRDTFNQRVDELIGEDAAQGRRKNSRGQSERFVDAIMLLE
jgi:hypothetical protein